MEENTKKNQKHKDTDPQQKNSAYPGHTSEEKKENSSSDEHLQTYSNLSDDEKDERLADSGPVRNPNYHDVNDANSASATSAKRYSKDTHNHTPSGTDGKTLEDFNDVEPKRDSNKAKNNETKTPGRT